MRRVRLFFRPQAVVLASSLVCGQAPEIVGAFADATQPAFGSAVRTLSDLTGDGIPELAIGFPSFDTTAPGGANVYDGADGSLIHTLTVPAVGRGYGFAIDDIGDVDGDGVSDFAVGGPGQDGVLRGIVLVISGQTGQSIHALLGPLVAQYGFAVAGLGDVDGDLVPDFAVGANTFPLIGFDQGRVSVISGASGLELYSVFGASGELFGSALAGLDDIDGDGFGDWIAGAPGSSSARIHSGASGAFLREYSISPNSDAAFGSALDRTGDLDGDGISDVIIGSPGESGGQFVQRGFARVYSSVTGSELFSMTGGFNNDHLGWSVAGADDLSGDGVPDVLVGVPMYGSMAFITPGYVTAFSGSDGSFLFNFSSGTQSGAAFGDSLDFVGDTDCDGFPEYLVGAPGLREALHLDFEPNGLTPTIGTRFCQATPNSSGGAALITALGSACLGLDDLVLAASPVPPNQPGIFFYGGGALELPFGNGFRCVGGGPVFRLFPIAVSSPSGCLSVDLGLSNLPPGGAIGAGDVLRFQAWFRDPAAGGAGFDLSDGLRLTFQP